MRRCAPSRGAGKCGEGRGLCGSAAGQNLFPCRRECRGSPAASKPPFVVGSNCAIFGTPCGGGHPSCRSVAPLHTVAALRFPAPSGPPIAPLPRNRLAFSAAGGASPLSSSPQNPLRWAFVGAPIGCAEKRKRFLMVSREKGLAAAFQAPPETPCSALFTGALARQLPGLCLLYQPLTPTKVRDAPGCSAFLFCCRTPAV